jgi:hypothetical protein
MQKRKCSALRWAITKKKETAMLTGDIRNQVDQIWNAFWSGGVSNPLSVIEQITYLLFIKRLDELQTLEESKAEALGAPLERRIFPKGKDDKGRPHADMRWSRFKNFEPREMMAVVDEHVDDHAELHIDERVVGIGKERRAPMPKFISPSDPHSTSAHQFDLDPRRQSYVRRFDDRNRVRDLHRREDGSRWIRLRLLRP